MASNEYELKVGVFGHEKLTISDLLQYIEAEVNDRLAKQVKKLNAGSKSNEKFTATFEQVLGTEIEQQEYVGFLFIYNNCILETVEYTKDMQRQHPLQELGITGTDDTFMIIVEMEGKGVNVVHQEGVLLSNKYHSHFHRLTFENSHDLIDRVNDFMYQMIANYYSPEPIGEEEEIGEDEEDEQEMSHARPSPYMNEQYELNYIRREADQNNVQGHNSNQSAKPLMMEQSESLFESARRERQEKLKDIEEKQKDIDDNIGNLQKVLENMDVHIRSKVETDWFSNLRNSIYSKVEKESQIYSKSNRHLLNILNTVKLTQRFIDENADSASKNTYKVPLETIVLKRRRQMIMRLQLNAEQQTVVIEVYADSTYQQLAEIALRKLGLKLTPKNVGTMKKTISDKIIGFVEELNRLVKEIHNKSTDTSIRSLYNSVELLSRSYLKSAN